MKKGKHSAGAPTALENSYNCEAMRTIISRAVDELRARDSLLLEYDVNERSIAHKLTNYLQAEFLGWEVDCEHNRNHDNPKTLPLQRKKVSNDDLHACTVFPDIIVHHRNTDSNLLVIKIKKSTNTSSARWDKQKLSAFKKVLGYKFAVFLRLETGSNSSGRTCQIEFSKEP